MRRRLPRSTIALFRAVRGVVRTGMAEPPHSRRERLRVDGSQRGEVAERRRRQGSRRGIPYFAGRHARQVALPRGSFDRRDEGTRHHRAPSGSFGNPWKGAVDGSMVSSGGMVDRPFVHDVIERRARPHIGNDPVSDGSRASLRCSIDDSASFRDFLAATVCFLRGPTSYGRNRCHGDTGSLTPETLRHHRCHATRNRLAPPGRPCWKRAPPVRDVTRRKPTVVRRPNPSASTPTIMTKPAGPRSRRPGGHCNELAWPDILRRSSSRVEHVVRPGNRPSRVAAVRRTT